MTIREPSCRLRRNRRGSETMDSIQRPITMRMSTRSAYDLDLRDVRGQIGARRALEIAAAGGHNVLAPARVRGATRRRTGALSEPRWAGWWGARRVPGGLDEDPGERTGYANTRSPSSGEMRGVRMSRPALAPGSEVRRLRAVPFGPVKEITPNMGDPFGESRQALAPWRSMSNVRSVVDATPSQRWRVSVSLASFYGSTAWLYARPLATASISWAIRVALACPRPLPMRS